MKFNKLSGYTLGIRHYLVKLIAPKLYNEYLNIYKAPRPMIQFVLECFGEKSLVGVEIGVATGFNSLSIIETLNINKLFLIDPYISYIEENNKNHAGDEYINAYPMAKQRLNKFKDKTIFIKKTSLDAINLIPNELDFVYIDGNHSYTYVKSDIEKYYPKVKDGGIIGGHDYSNSFIDVIQAVNEFTTSRKLKLFTHGCDWWVIK